MDGASMKYLLDQARAEGRAEAAKIVSGMRDRHLWTDRDVWRDETLESAAEAILSASPPDLKEG